MKKILLLILFLTTIISIFAQNVDFNPLKNHWLSEKEMTENIEHRNFTPTDPPESVIRPVAEYEPMEYVIIRYPFGIPMLLITEMSQEIKVVTLVASSSEQSSVTSQYQSAGVNMDNCEFMIAPTDTYWARDYSPWFIAEEDKISIVDFPYNRPRPGDDNIPVVFAQEYGFDLYGMNVEHTGGNYMADGYYQAASTELVLEENPGLSEQEVRDYFENYLGASNYHINDDPQGEYIKHIDCWGKFLAPNKILIGQVPESNSQYDEYEEVAEYYENAISSYGTPYEVYRVYCPSTYSNPTPYTNSLILNDRVFVPQTGNSADAAAIATYQEAMPGYEIIGIDYYDWMDTDALHCRTHEVPDDEMMYIYHLPVQPEINVQEEYSIECNLIPYSGEDLNTDNLTVYYKKNNEEEFSTAILENQSGDEYKAILENINAGDVVKYYIHAEDLTENKANHPFIGEADPHTFTVIGETDESPVINHTPIETIMESEVPFDFECIVTDDNAVETVELSFNINSGTLVNENFTNSSSDNYTYTFNTDVQDGDVVNYKIIATDDAGNQTTIPEEGFYTIDVSAVSNDENIEITKIVNVYPNPVKLNSANRNNKFNIDYSLTSDQNVEIGIYNVKGQFIKNLVNESQNAGMHSISWNGKDNKYSNVKSGIYFVKLDTQKMSQVRKLILIK